MWKKVTEIFLQSLPFIRMKKAQFVWYVKVEINEGPTCFHCFHLAASQLNSIHTQAKSFYLEWTGGPWNVHSVIQDQTDD